MRRIASLAQDAMLPGKKAIFATGMPRIGWPFPAEPRQRRLLKGIAFIWGKPIETSAFTKKFNFKLIIHMRILLSDRPLFYRAKR